MIAGLALGFLFLLAWVVAHSYGSVTRGKGDDIVELIAATFAVIAAVKASRVVTPSRRVTLVEVFPFFTAFLFCAAFATGWHALLSGLDSYERTSSWGRVAYIVLLGALLQYLVSHRSLTVPKAQFPAFVFCIMLNLSTSLTMAAASIVDLNDEDIERVPLLVLMAHLLFPLHSFSFLVMMIRGILDAKFDEEDRLHSVRITLWSKLDSTVVLREPDEGRDPIETDTGFFAGLIVCPLALSSWLLIQREAAPSLSLIFFQLGVFGLCTTCMIMAFRRANVGPNDRAKPEQTILCFVPVWLSAVLFNCLDAYDVATDSNEVLHRSYLVALNILGVINCLSQGFVVVRYSLWASRVAFHSRGVPTIARASSAAHAAGSSPKEQGPSTYTHISIPFLRFTWSLLVAFNVGATIFDATFTLKALTLRSTLGMRCMCISHVVLCVFCELFVAASLWRSRGRSAPSDSRSFNCPSTVEPIGSVG